LYSNKFPKPYTLSEFISSFDFIIFQTEILSKQKEESLEKEVVELKARLRDLEDKLKKSENRVYESLGTEQRLKSRPILEDSDNDEQQNAASEKRNAGTSKVDTEDLAPRLSPRRFIEVSSPGAPPRFRLWVRLRGYALNGILLSLTIFSIYYHLLHLDNICFSGSRGSFSRERRRGR
jgi:hypothetical protein